MNKFVVGAAALLLAVGLITGFSNIPKPSTSPKSPEQLIFRGRVLDIHQYMVGATPCYELLLMKDDGTTVKFALDQWPPAWKDMSGVISLEHSSWNCGYHMISAKPSN